MNRNIFNFMAAAVIISSCSLQPETETLGPVRLPEENVLMEFSITDGPFSRSVDAGWKETDVKELSVYIFNESGDLDVAEKVENQTSIQMNCQTGRNKRIYALVNYAPRTNITRESDIKSLTSSLTDNSQRQFVMSGMVTREITNSGSIQIPVARSVAKISIDRIANQVTDLNLKTQEFKVTGIYTINVPVGEYPMFTGTYTPTLWCNQMKWETSAGTDLFTHDAVNQKISWGQSYNKTHTFYVYPNPTATDFSAGVWKARKTRLVIEVLIGATTYYYPITLDEVKSNTHYRFTGLSITRKGSDNQDVPVSSDQASFNISIEDWNQSDMGDIVI